MFQNTKLTTQTNLKRFLISKTNPKLTRINQNHYFFLNSKNTPTPEN